MLCILTFFTQLSWELEAKALAKAEEKQRPLTADEKAELGARTRQAKNSNLTMAQLLPLWNQRLTSQEARALSTVEYRQSRSDHVIGGKAITEQQAVDYARAHAFERDSTISEKKLKETALRHGVGQVNVERIQQEVVRQKQAGAIIAAENDGQTLVTMREVLNEEKAMIDFARERRGFLIVDCFKVVFSQPLVSLFGWNFFDSAELVEFVKPR